MVNVGKVLKSGKFKTIFHSEFHFILKFCFLKKRHLFGRFENARLSCQLLHPPLSLALTFGIRCRGERRAYYKWLWWRPFLLESHQRVWEQKTPMAPILDGVDLRLPSQRPQDHLRNGFLPHRISDVVLTQIRRALHFYRLLFRVTGKKKNLLPNVSYVIFIQPKVWFRELF